MLHYPHCCCWRKSPVLTDAHEEKLQTWSCPRGLLHSEFLICTLLVEFRLSGVLDPFACCHYSSSSSYSLSSTSSLSVISIDTNCCCCLCYCSPSGGPRSFLRVVRLSGKMRNIRQQSFLASVVTLSTVWGECVCGTSFLLGWAFVFVLCGNIVTVTAVAFQLLVAALQAAICVRSSGSGRQY